MIGSIIFSILLAEMAYRIYSFDSIFFDQAQKEHRFWQYDPDLGWSPVPGSEGQFQNPRARYNGYVKFDDRGLRITGNDYNVKEKSILLIGDSTTAGLEVDNQETYASVLERLLNENGCSYTVYNAGVRGYGTDQAYWRMTKYMKILKPDYVIYMFTGNDLVENRTIRRLHRKYGKPVYALVDKNLVLLNHPSKMYDSSYYAYINYDDGQYKIKEGFYDGHLVRQTGISARIAEFIRNNFAIYYPIRIAYNSLFVKDKPKPEEVDNSFDYQILEAIVTKIRNQSNNLIITSFTLGNDGRNRSNQKLEDLSKKLKVQFADISPYFRDPSSTYRWSTDGHWNEKGHNQAALALYQELKPRLCN